MPPCTYVKFTAMYQFWSGICKKNVHVLSVDLINWDLLDASRWYMSLCGQVVNCPSGGHHLGTPSFLGPSASGSVCLDQRPTATRQWLTSQKRTSAPTRLDDVRPLGLSNQLFTRRALSRPLSSVRWTRRIDKRAMLSVTLTQCQFALSSHEWRSGAPAAAPSSFNYMPANDASRVIF